ncbi:MAG TPA: NUDIX domain-containing protein [Fibrobacteria bacterium]|nr:NUDIX domain-containing protein [Fibrobacteria bacterium]HOX51751.1 NUDIX domain-containing protein [Fibrobacteria bacterium]
MGLNLVLSGVEPGTFPRLEAKTRSGGGQILSWDGEENLFLLLDNASVPVDETIAVMGSPEGLALLQAARLATATIGEATVPGTDHRWPDETAACRWLEAQNQLDTCAWPIATVGGLVFRPDGRALFIRTAKWSGTWGVPGGKIDRGEKHLDAFRREIREETGLDVEDIRLCLVQDAISDPQFHRDRHFLLLNYVAQAILPVVVKLNHESLESGWYSLDEAWGLDLNRPTRQLVDHLRQESTMDPHILS